MKFYELANEWLNENKKYDVKDRTYLRYEVIIRVNLNPLIGHVEIRDFNPRNIQHYLNEIRTSVSQKTKRVLSTSSYNSIIVVLQLIFKYACDFNLLESNPTSMVKKAKRENKKAQAFTRQEQAKIQKYIDSSNNDEYFPITLCFYSGLRIGELIALTYKDIDLRTGILHIRKTKSRIKTNGNWIVKTETPKTKSSIRDIPLPYFIVEELRRLKKKNLSTYVCVLNDGTIMDDRLLRNRFASLLKKNHIRKLNFHCIRHTFATRALENKMDIKTLSEILGHANASTTLNIYAHSMIEHKKSLMRRFKKIM